jgi:cytochrome P450 family 135
MSAATLPPGPSLPRALQTVGWVKRVGPFLDRCQARYGDVFTLRIGQETWVMVSDPAAIKQVFTALPTQAHAGEANAILGPVLGRHSVLLLDEGEHMAQRKLLLPPFHGDRMERHGALMAEAARREIARWPTGQPFAVRPSMQAITLEVIMRAVFGLRDGPRMELMRGRLADMLDQLSDPRRMAAVAVLGPKGVKRVPGFRRIIESVDEPIYAEIRERRDTHDLHERDDILSLLLQARHEDGSPMADKELRDELVTLLVAGHETTATALSWAIERLLRHPVELARLADADDDYYEAVAKETLRLRPVIPIVARRLKAPMRIGDY